MEKLSSILPSSSRVTSVDLDESPPARPGAPLFGRKMGVNSVRDRVSLSSQAKEMAASQTLLGKNPKEASRAKAIGELNRRFFETRLNPTETRIPASEQIAAQMPVQAPGQQIEIEDSPPMEQGKEKNLEQMFSQYEASSQTPARISIEA